MRKYLIMLFMLFFVIGCATTPSERHTEVIPQQTVQPITLTFPPSMSVDAVQELTKNGPLVWIHQEMKIEDAAFKGGSQEGGTASSKPDTSIDADIPVYSQPSTPSTPNIPGTKPPTDPGTPPPVITPDPPAKETLIYSHYNPNGNLCGTGGDDSALVICENQDWYDSCEISGVELDQHSGLNNNKKVYRKCGVPNLAGTVTCKKGNKVYTAQVNATGLQKDGCY